MNALSWLINFLVLLYVTISSTPEVHGEASAAPEADPVVPFGRAWYIRMPMRVPPRPVPARPPRLPAAPRSVPAVPRSAPVASSAGGASVAHGVSGSNRPASGSNAPLKEAPTAKQPSRNGLHEPEHEIAHGNARETAQNIGEVLSQAADTAEEQEERSA